MRLSELLFGFTYNGLKLRETHMIVRIKISLSLLLSFIAEYEKVLLWHGIRKASRDGIRTRVAATEIAKFGMNKSKVGQYT